GVVCLLGLGLFDKRGGRLDLDDIGAELRRDLRRVRDHVERGFPLLADGGAEPQSVLDAGGPGGRGIFLVVENVVTIDLQYERNLAGVLGDPGLKKSERRRERVASRIDSELKVIARVVRRRIDREASRRAMLEALVHGQDYELAGARELAVVEHPRQVAAHACVFGIVVAQNLSNSLGHMPLSSLGSITCSLHLYHNIAAAQWAAPSSPAAGFSDTRTSIRFRISFNLPLAKNPSTNAPPVSIGKIFGAMPPPRKTPPNARTLSARLAASEP